MFMYLVYQRMLSKTRMKENLIGYTCNKLYILSGGFYEDLYADNERSRKRNS